MKRWLKLAALVSVPLIVVLVLLWGVYLGVVSGLVNIPGLSGALKTTGDPVSPEVRTRAAAVEEQIGAEVRGRSAFLVELTDQQLTDLLSSRIDPRGEIRDAAVDTRTGEIAFSGHLNGVVAVPFTGSAEAEVREGQLHLTLTGLSVSGMFVPGGLRAEVQALLNGTLDLNQTLQQSGASALQGVRLEEGRAIVVGIQQAGRIVSDEMQTMLVNASNTAAERLDPVPPGADLVPRGMVGSKDGAELYLALGDSLAANVGVSDPRDGYVSRFHGYLERKGGRPLGLRNVGVSGESSISIYNGQLRQALEEIEQRKNDGDPGTRVSVVTLDLGANDIIGHATSQDCVSNPVGPICQARIDAGLSAFRTNFEDIVPTLALALEPEAELYVMTVYNPFNLGAGLPLEDLSNETISRLNDIIREVAAASGALLADPYPIMGSNAGAWTNILVGDVHPNPKGYQVLAYSLVESR